jgi:hypothetical protein
LSRKYVLDDCLIHGFIYSCLITTDYAYYQLEKPLKLETNFKWCERFYWTVRVYILVVFVLSEKGIIQQMPV